MPKTSDNDDIQQSRLGSLGASAGLGEADFEPGALPQALLTPHGGPVGPVAPPRKLPVAKPENFICMRGPCKNLMETKSPADVENADYEPVALDRYCKALPGVLVILDDLVYECSEWDPKDEDAARKKRREKFAKSKLGRACRDADQKREAVRAEARAKIDEGYNERERANELAKAQKQINIDSGIFEPQEEE